MPRTTEGTLADFALFLTRTLAISPLMDNATALSKLFKQSSPSAHEIVLAFRHHLESAHLSAASINRHLATLRSVSKLGRMLGLMNWYLEVPGLKAEKRRQTTGPTIADFEAWINAGAPCPTRDCGHLVKRLVQSGRSTFYCARCQR